MRREAGVRPIAGRGTAKISCESCDRLDPMKQDATFGWLKGECSRRNDFTDGWGNMSGHSILLWAVAAALLGGSVSAILGPPTRTVHIHFVRAP